MSELVKSAQSQPQDITVHCKSVAVVVSRETFDRLAQARGSLVDFMQRFPCSEPMTWSSTATPAHPRYLIGPMGCLIDTNVFSELGRKSA